MTVDELLQALAEKNVDLWVEGKLLRFRAPENALDNQLLTGLRKHKSAIIKALDGAAVRQNGESHLEPLSIGQQALYFLHSISPQSSAYNCASAARICSPVDIEAMQKAFEHLLGRHDALRTTFEIKDGQPQRCIHAHGKLDFHQISATGWDEDRLHDEVRKEYQRPFDLRTDALLRVRLFSVSETEHVFLMSLHHIVFDAWSLWLLHDEFRTLYQQYAGGETALLPVLQVSYSDFVREQQELETNERGERLWQYWKERLAGELTPLELPLDRPCAERPGRGGATHCFRIPRELSARLKEVARSQGVTPFMLLLAIFKTWLHLSTGQEDLIVGTVTSGRKSKFSRVAGYFANTLAIRSDASGKPTFLDFLAQVKKRTVQAIEHEEYPFPLLVKRLNPRRDSDRLPICNVMFDLQKPQQFSEVTRLFDEDGGHIDWGGLEVHPFDLDQQEGQFDLTLDLFETNDSYFGTLKYDLDLFDTSTGERIARHFVRLAEVIAEDASLAISDYEMVSDEERSRIISFGTGKALKPLGDWRIHGLFERQAERVPDRVAAVCDQVELTYDELNRRANQVARRLQSRGVAAGSLVACHLERGIDVPVVLLSILKAGGVYVPLDIDSPAQRVQQIVVDSGAKFVIANTDSTLAFESEDNIELLLMDQCRHSAAGYSDTNLDIDLPRDALTYVMHTSGSTGTPKGVCVSHRAFAEHIASINESLRLTDTDCMLQFSNLTFDPSLEQIFATWSFGAAVVFRGNSMWPPDKFWQVIQEHQVTVAHIPVLYFKQVTDAFARAGNAADSLRLIVVGGDVFPVETLKVWQGGRVQILNEYGPTEAVIGATIYDISDCDASVPRVAIGRPKAGSSAYVLDDGGRRTPIGIPGELYLGGSMLADGYLNNPELTGERFVADPFSAQPGALMYRTGDRARWTSEGHLEFLGRTDRQIKIHGQRIETGEIEYVLNANPCVQESFVQARNDVGSEAFLVAWLVPAVDIDPDPESLREFLASRLPHSMVPRQFITVPHLPVNSSGKIDPRQLPELPDVRPLESEYVAPRSETERVLIDVWSDVLNVDVVGVHDNFFDFGGGSLTSLQIVARASEAGIYLKGEPLTPELIFEYPSVGELAAFLESTNSE